ncbi:MAG: glyoxylase-like metal-dependent hydrolase (beta-lactamase superfamily II) [Arenicella sp.]|jgi:glyoxylase-like metal-dependent hydrolase (beta-lactamase superfamily II)
MLQTLPNTDIYTVDALYHQPQLASIHLIRSNNRIAIVDTGTQYSVPQVLAALVELDLSYSDVDYIILTHIHLDHAGGASTLMQLCPNAQLIVHPKGARHMADPSRLVAGASAVYGVEEFARLYGEIGPIDESRIHQPADGETIDFAGRSLTFIDSPGHANHHHCIIDEQTNSAFTGDTLGVGYRALRDAHHAFVMPTTTPVQFNPDALHASIDRIMSYTPDTLYLTHYSSVTPSAKIIAGLHEQIDDYVMLTQKAADSGDQFEVELAINLNDYLVRRCMNELSNVDEATARHWIKLDADLNAQGLVFWWQHKRTA